MARYTVRFAPRAERELGRLQPSIRNRVTRAAAQLADDPRPRDSRVVAGWSERTYRIRVGQYRVLYEIHDDEVLVLVVRVAHRKDAYELREHEEPYHLEAAAST